MAFHYSDVVPWGRSYEEYVRMFALSEADLRTRILGCGDGPASFNAELTRRGGTVVSADPLYQVDRSVIAQRIDETFEVIMSQIDRERHRFVWKEIRDPEHMAEERISAMRLFLDDYETGRAQGRYLAAALPSLPFADRPGDGRDSRSARKVCPRSLWPVARRKLDQLNRVRELREFGVPPENRLKRLKGDRTGQHSIRINEQYRICFRWEHGHAYEVEITDYH